MTIRSLRDAWYDHAFLEVRFEAEINGTQIICRIDFAAMQDHFRVRGRQGEDMLEAFQSNSQRILSVAESLFTQGRAENGEMLIGTRDF